MLTPDSIRDQILRVQVELRKAPDVVQELEVAAEEADLVADTALQRALLNATGTVDERKAMAKLQSRGQHDDAVVKRAAFNRARLRVRLLEAELMSLQALLKSVQAEL
jgi:hypothetical protein